MRYVNEEKEKMIDSECLFCCEISADCRCTEIELETKKAFLNFFVDVLAEFSPKQAKSITMYDAADFVNEWFSDHFHGQLSKKR